MKHLNKAYKTLARKTMILSLLLSLILSVNHLKAQTNVFDDVIATSPNHTALKAALEQEGLDAALRNNAASLTVFAPTNDAFTSLASQLNTDLNGLLSRSDLNNILLYHVLGNTVLSSSISNGQIAQPLSDSNTIKLSVHEDGSVFANQAKVETADVAADNGVVHITNAVLLPVETVADIAIDNGFSSLTAAVIEAELLNAITDPFATLTVFAPTNEAFDSLAARLQTDIPGLLALENLQDILLYHVLGQKSMASDLSNGALLNALNSNNTLKVTITSENKVFLNQAEITGTDVEASNGVVHILGDVVLPGKTVADVAIDNGFSSLVAAVVAAELLPALSDPFASYTVFAPSNEAFDSLAARLQTDIPGLLALENLQDILLYHVLGQKSMAADLSNGALLNALNNGNSLKVTLTSDNKAFLNQAEITSTDIDASNGVVHVLNAVVLPGKTVADVAIDNGFTSLVAAVVAAELLPALSNPFATYTVFAPTNDAFTTLAGDLNLTLQEVLELPNLADILLYHVIGERFESTQLSNGDVNTLLEGETVTINTDDGVMVNNAKVDQADIAAENGIVHVIDAVLQPGLNSLFDLNETIQALAYPNPCLDRIQIDGVLFGTYELIGADGAVKQQGDFRNSINSSELSSGLYWINIRSDKKLYQTTVIKQ